MLNRIATFIDKHNLLDASGLYLVALSGGADSVALLLALRELGYRVEAVHCNFHLRGQESDRDEQFCLGLCGRLDVTLHRIHFDTRTYAHAHKVSIEMAARELRYRYFEQLRQDIGAEDVCVAHHRDDSVETAILNLIRGTGLRGLTGISPRNAHVVRPLLCMSRHDIESFLRARGQDYVTDSTNLETDALRNRVRLQVLPLLAQLNPAAVENIHRTTEHLLEARQALDSIVERFRDSKVLELSSLEEFGSSEYVVFEWLKNYGFNRSQAMQIMEARTGRVFSSPAGYEVLADRGRLVVERMAEPVQPLRLPEPGKYVLPGRGYMVFEQKMVDASFQPSRTADCATLDADRVALPLTVRQVHEGDWMVPYGMKGRKLLSDLMTDRKMSLFDKRRQLVVVDATDRVLWLVGVRVDARVAVSHSTKRVLTLHSLSSGCRV